MSKDYSVPNASATFVDPTGQMEYVLSWDGTDVWMSGTNLNTGTEWSHDTPVEEPERFGSRTTQTEFFAWVAKFVEEATP